MPRCLCGTYELKKSKIKGIKPHTRRSEENEPFKACLTVLLVLAVCHVSLRGRHVYVVCGHAFFSWPHSCNLPYNYSSDKRCECISCQCRGGRVAPVTGDAVRSIVTPT